jgi:major membrane immunogen (membrane-anchored lipoprotein)
MRSVPKFYCVAALATALLALGASSAAGAVPDGTYTFNKSIHNDGAWQLTLTTVVVSGSTVRTNIDYNNIGAVPLGLTCATTQPTTLAGGGTEIPFIANVCTTSPPEPDMTIPPGGHDAEWADFQNTLAPDTTYTLTWTGWGTAGFSIAGATTQPPGALAPTPNLESSLTDQPSAQPATTAPASPTTQPTFTPEEEDTLTQKCLAGIPQAIALEWLGRHIDPIFKADWNKFTAIRSASNSFDDVQTSIQSGDGQVLHDIFTRARIVFRLTKLLGPGLDIIARKMPAGVALGITTAASYCLEVVFGRIADLGQRTGSAIRDLLIPRATTRDATSIARTLSRTHMRGLARKGRMTITASAPTAGVWRFDMAIVRNSRHSSVDAVIGATQFFSQARSAHVAAVIEPKARALMRRSPLEKAKMYVSFTPTRDRPVSGRPVQLTRTVTLRP